MYICLLFELANDLYDYKETFHELGVKPDVDFEVLKSVLEHLSQKYQLIEDNSSTDFHHNYDCLFF
jgi:hypothetical protein